MDGQLVHIFLVCVCFSCKIWFKSTTQPRLSWGSLSFQEPISTLYLDVGDIYSTDRVSNWCYGFVIVVGEDGAVKILKTEDACRRSSLGT